MFYDAQLAEWRGQLQRITADYSEAAAELAKRRAAWEATRAIAADLAPALIGRVDSVLAEITLAEKALSLPLGDQLKLARRGNCGAAGGGFRNEGGRDRDRLLSITACS